METTIDILKEILYFTDVGEDIRYAEALLDAIHKLEKSEVTLTDSIMKNLTLAKCTSSSYDKEKRNE